MATDSAVSAEASRTPNPGLPDRIPDLPRRGLILFQLICTPGVDTGGIDIDIDLGRKIGIFLGLIAAAGIAYGGWRAGNEPVADRPSGQR